MARNREFDDALDELKMLHDAKNHDYATADNPYKNLEGVSRIGIEPWRGVVIRLMDKFERVQQYCVNGELAIKSEGMEDTFKDIAVYSTLAMILFRKGQDEEYAKEVLTKKGYKDWSKDGKPPLKVDGHGNVEGEWEPPSMPDSPKWELPVDDKYNGDESFTHSMIAMREAAEKQQEDDQRRSDENMAHIKSLIDKRIDANNN